MFPPVLVEGILEGRVIGWDKFLDTMGHGMLIAGLFYHYNGIATQNMLFKNRLSRPYEVDFF